MMSFKLVKQSLINHGKGQAPPPAYHVSDRKSFQVVLFKKDIPNILSRFPTLFDMLYVVLFQ